MKLCIQSRPVGLPLSKIFEFLRFQISQLAITNISMKKGVLEFLAVRRILSLTLVAVDQCIPSFCQHEVAKGQKKNKSSMSSIEDVHMIQNVGLDMEMSSEQHGFCVQPVYK